MILYNQKNIIKKWISDFHFTVDTTWWFSWSESCYLPTLLQKGKPHLRRERKRREFPRANRLDEPSSKYIRNYKINPSKILLEIFLNLSDDACEQISKFCILRCSRIKKYISFPYYFYCHRGINMPVLFALSI